jgi:hypothetical protein
MTATGDRRRYFVRRWGLESPVPAPARGIIVPSGMLRVRSTARLGLASERRASYLDEGCCWVLGPDALCACLRDTWTRKERRVYAVTTGPGSPPALCACRSASVPVASSCVHPFAVAPIIVVDSSLNFRYLRHAGAPFSLLRSGDDDGCRLITLVLQTIQYTNPSVLLHHHSLDQHKQ